jgi:hypothetical protein
MDKKLSKELGRIVEEEFQSVYDREIGDDGFLNQEDFEDCKARAKAMLESSFQRVENVLALAIAKHRKEYHNEDRDADIKALSDMMPPEDVSVGLRGWWGM